MMIATDGKRTIAHHPRKATAKIADQMRRAERIENARVLSAAEAITREASK